MSDTPNTPPDSPDDQQNSDNTESFWQRFKNGINRENFLIKKFIDDIRIELKKKLSEEKKELFQKKIPAAKMKAKVWSKRILIATTIAGASAGVAELSGGYTTKAVKAIRESYDAYQLKSAFGRLDEVKRYFDIHDKDFKNINSADIQNNPQRFVEDFREARRQLQKGISAAFEIKQTKVRFHPKVLSGITKKLNKASIRLNSNDVRELHKAADCFRHTLGCDLFVSFVKQLDTNGIITLSETLKNLQGKIRKMSKILSTLTDSDIKEYSNNAIINDHLKEKYQKQSRLPTYDLAFGSQGREVIKLQKLLEEFGFLKEPFREGHYDKRTKKAVLEFQLKKGIIKSKKSAGAGRTGPKTRKALDGMID